jgi:ABC-type phosphate transport system substrate-binding protein
MRRLRFALRLLVAASLAAAAAARAEIVVVVHPDNPVQALSPRDVSDLYLGRTRALGSTRRALVLDHPRDSDRRRDFFNRVNGMDISRVNAYWARLQFSGDALPPAAMRDDRSVLDIVRRQRDAIGYVEAAHADESVRIVLRLKD